MSFNLINNIIKRIFADKIKMDYCQKHRRKLWREGGKDKQLSLFIRHVLLLPGMCVEQGGYEDSSVGLAGLLILSRTGVVWGRKEVCKEGAPGAKAAVCQVSTRLAFHSSRFGGGFATNIPTKVWRLAALWNTVLR